MSAAPGLVSSRQVLLVMVGLGLLLCVDLLLGPYCLVRFHDTFDNVFFHEYFSAHEMLRHGLSFWSDKAGGLPAFVGVYPPYGPLTLGGMILPPWLLGRVIDIACVCLSGFGLFRLLADHLGTDRRAALLAAVPFGLTGLSYNSLTFFNYFPLFYVCFAEVTRPGTWGYRLPRLLAMLVLLSCSMPVLSLPVYSGAQLALVVVLDQTPWRRRRILGTFLVWIGYALFFAPTLSSLLQYAPLSNRLDVDGLSPPLPLWTAFLRLGETYGFVLDICLSMAAGLYFAWEARGSAQVRRAALFCLLLAAAILLSDSAIKPLLGNTPLRHIDFYHYSAPLMIGVSLVTGLGISHMLRVGLAVSWPRAGASLGLVALSMSTDKVLLRAFVLLFLLGGLEALRASRAPARAGRFRLAAAICGLGLAAGVAQMQTMLMMDYSFEPYARGFGHHKTLLALAKEQEREPFRVAGVNLSPAVIQSHGIEAADILTQIYSRRYRDYFQAIVAPQLDTPEKLALYPGTAYREVFLAPTRDSFSTRRHLVYNNNAPTHAGMWNVPLLAAMNVRYLISPRPVDGLEAFADLLGVDDGPDAPLAALAGTRVDAMYRLPLHVYRLRDSFPRAWLASQARVLPSEDAVRAALEGLTVDTLARQALFSVEDAAGLPPALLAPDAAVSPKELRSDRETLALARHTKDRLEYQGVLTAPRLLVVSNNYHPGWTARVNGVDTPVMRANHAFQAVALASPGPVRVELAFRDPLAAWTHLATLVGLMMVCSCALLVRSERGQTLSAPPADERTSLNLPWLGARRLAFRQALLWGVASVVLTSALFLLLRVLREPAGSQRLVWFILAKSAMAGGLAAPLAGALLGLCIGPEQAAGSPGATATDGPQNA